MGASSDQFLHLLWRPPYVLFSYYIGALRSFFLYTILGPPDHFLRLLYGAPQISFFSYNIGAPLRSVSLFTICPPSLKSVSLHAIGGHLRFYFFHKIYGGLLRSVSPLTIWGPPQVSLFAYYVRPPQISFCVYFLGAALRSVFSLTGWGPLRSVSSLTRGGSLRSVYSHTICHPLQVDFFTYYMWGPP